MKDINKSNLPKIIILAVLALIIALSGGAGIYFTTQYTTQKQAYTSNTQQAQKLKITIKNDNAQINVFIKNIQQKSDELRKQYLANADAAKALMNKYMAFFIVFYVVCALMIVCFIAVAFGKKKFSFSKLASKIVVAEPEEESDADEEVRTEDKPKSDFDDIEDILKKIGKEE